MSEVHHHTPVDVTEQFEFTSGARNKALAALGIGIVLLIAGSFLVTSGSGHEAAHGVTTHGNAAEGGAHAFHWTQRLWANLWLNNIWFAGIALIGVFFVAFNYVAYAGWSSAIIRVPLSFGNYLPIAGILTLAIFLLGHHDLFHWTHSELFDPASKEFDKIIAGKAFWLNLPFFISRLVIYFVLWFVVFSLIKKTSLEEDVHGGTSYWHKNTVYGAVFIIVFAVSSSTAAWDWVMSIDPHWFSTLFGWYVFASWFVSGLATITLVVVLLKDNGYLKIVNHNHLHDLGKFIFAFSIFWSYLWIAQFLLIYYANLPEEGIYFLERLEGHGGIYRPLFFINVGLNFFFPFLLLMTREAKRHSIFLKIVCVGVLSGHWIDFYLMIMPGTVGPHGGFGAMEVGAFLFYAGLFALVIGTYLSKSLLIAKNHPMLEESIHHNI
ncbi:MAG: quinol:cytochrome C oxidoreductase [Bacteroidota bacterium]